MTFDNNKPSILLDLDLTLICAETYKEYNFKKYKNKSKKFDFEDMEGYYIIFARPHLQKFLDYLFKNFNVTVWTAASKDYALFVIDKFIVRPHRQLHHIFFSYHCDVSEDLKEGSKDLRMLWDIYGLKEYKPNSTYILDDNCEVYDNQPGLCIEAPPFKFKRSMSYEDTFLLDIIPTLEKLKNKN